MHNMKYLHENIIDEMQTHMGVKQSRGDNEAIHAKGERGEGWGWISRKKKMNIQNFWNEAPNHRRERYPGNILLRKYLFPDTMLPLP